MLVFTSRAFIALLLLLSVSSTHAHNKVVVIPLAGDDATPATVYEIGDEGPGGGIVFDVSNDGLNGLEAAPVDQGSAPWNCSGTDLADVDNVEFYGPPDNNSGADNTLIIGIHCGISSAAAVAALYIWPNGQRDGFLPNREELNLLFAQKNVVGSFGGSHWSSSEVSNDMAWFQLDDGEGTSPKSNNNQVRAVRAF